MNFGELKKIIVPEAFFDNPIILYKIKHTNNKTETRIHKEMKWVVCMFDLLSSFYVIL